VADGPRGSSARAEPEERVRRLTELAERLLGDVARTGYGEQPALDYLTPACAAEVLRSLDTCIRDANNNVESDYGERVAGTAYLPEIDGPVQVELFVEDQSVLRAPNGLRTPLPPAWWHLKLELDSSCTRITSLSVTTA